MASAEDFDGDEFSNNLFSDLAPLLTLFGEQVTMQFLSLSMGWADNVLLAMGPLGIITIVVSTIRISGGRRLKSLIGRARETQSVAEQELLSSTSANVCELWNGQQVTRLIGEAKGMTTVVISDKGDVYSLEEAFSKGKFRIQGEKIVNRENVPYGPKTLRETLDSNLESAPLNLPANLSLNTRSALASPTTLRLLAALGVALQTVALVFPGVAAYHFQWKKGDVPVAGYGYMCFVIGTVSLTIGIMLCGHIIESTTDETNYELTEDSKNEGLRFLCLQKALTLGDQEFPSCAIFLGGESGVLRTSRRGFQQQSSTWYESYRRLYTLMITVYRSRATVWVFVTLSGYIVQFVGLRALHWSATIVQLGVTIIMTCIRALARMSLASDPETSTLSLTGHEIAWLTSLVKFKSEKVSVQKGVWHRLHKTFGHFTNRRADVTHQNHVGFDREQYFWELITDHSEESGAVVDWLNDGSRSTSSETHTGDRAGFVSSQLLQRVRGPLRSSIHFLPKTPDELEVSKSHSVADSVQTYVRIASGIRDPAAASKENDAKRASIALCGVLDEIMRYDDNKSVFRYFKWDEETEKYWKDSSEMCWEFSVREGRVSEYSEKDKKQSRFKILFRQNRERRCPMHWLLDPSARVQLEAAISLSLYTDAARLMYATGEARTGMKKTPRYTDRHFRRVVGYAKRGDVSRLQTVIQLHLASRVKSSTLPSMRKEEVNLQMKGLIKAVDPSGKVPAVQRNRLSEAIQKSNETAATQSNELGEDMRPLTQMLRQGISESYFGMFLSSSADHSDKSHEAQFEELFIEESSTSTKAFQYAQELFSIFMLAILSKVEHASVRYEMRDYMIEGKGVYVHPIAEVVVANKLATSIDEANALIIPALAKYQFI